MGTFILFIDILKLTSCFTVLLALGSVLDTYVAEKYEKLCTNLVFLMSVLIKIVEEFKMFLNTCSVHSSSTRALGGLL